jgi:Flp pilus assembly protein TadG
LRKTRQISVRAALEHFEAKRLPVRVKKMRQSDIGSEKVLATLSGLIVDRRGVTAVEFALVAPIALLMLFAEFALCDAMSAKRKLTITAHTIADLVARQSSVNSSSLSSILNASAQIAAPYSVSNMSIIIAELTTDNSGKTWVTWSSALNGAALKTGVQVVVPAGIAQNNTALIYSSATYSYTPLLGQSLFGALVFNSQFYENPRITSSVAYSN